VDGSWLSVVHNGVDIGSLVETRINDAEWHQLSIEFTNGNVSVAFLRDSFSKENAFSRLLPVDDSAVDVYIGSSAEDVGHYEGFVGCMRDIRVNADSLTPSWLAANRNASVNVSGSCDWSSNCEPDPCSGRGKCTDLWMHFTCDCRSPFWGLTCRRGLYVHVYCIVVSFVSA